MRKLASIRRVDGLRPIEGADLIECAVVGGWEVVVKKGEFAVGNLATYFEVDSWIPYELAPFLSKEKEPREYEGVKGERLKTVRLRKQLSQGLLLPIRHCFPDQELSQFTEDLDVTDQLGIIKWERPIPLQLRGQVKGNWPAGIPKTDEERCLSADTIVDTNIGKLSIKEIVDAKMRVDVLSFNHESNVIEYRPIIDWSVMTRRNTWVKITLKSGKELICTKNHKIWCQDIMAYREAAQIEAGQIFIVKTEK